MVGLGPKLVLTMWYLENKLYSSLEDVYMSLYDRVLQRNLNCHPNLLQRKVTTKTVLHESGGRGMKSGRFSLLWIN